jgi:hypothetical protein
MAIITPIAVVQQSERVQRAPAGSQALSSFSTAASVAVASRMPATRTFEVDMQWQLLTVHDSGISQIWGQMSHNTPLVPLVRIGDRVAPALRVVVCEPLGAVITAHNGEGRERQVDGHGMAAGEWPGASAGWVMAAGMWWGTSAMLALPWRLSLPPVFDPAYLRTSAFQRCTYPHAPVTHPCLPGPPQTARCACGPSPTRAAPGGCASCTTTAW